MQLSARNQIPARVTSINTGEAIANVEMDANGTRLVASITVEAVQQLGLTVSSQVTAVIKASDVMLARQLHAASADEGLTPTQASVLGITAGRGPLSLAELIEIEGLNPTMLSRVVGKLDSFGLIRRLRDPDDSRAARVEVTPEGQRTYQRISTQRAAIISEAVAGLSPDQEAALTAALPALEKLAEDLRAAVRRSRVQPVPDEYTGRA